MSGTVLFVIVAIVVGVSVLFLVYGLRRQAAQAGELAREAADSSSRFDQVFDNAITGMALADLSGSLTRINDRFCAMLGRDRDEVTGKSLVDFADDEDRLALEGAIAKVANDAPASLNGELRLVGGDGGTVLTLLNLTLIRTAGGDPSQFFVQAQVVTERDRLLRESAESARRFRGLLDSAPDAMVIVDETGEIVFVNAMAQLVFGYAREELLGSSIELLIPKRFRGGHRSKRDRYVGEGVSERPMNAAREVVAKRKDGTEFGADVRLSPIETAAGTLVMSSLRASVESQGAEAGLRGVEDETGSTG